MSVIGAVGLVARIPSSRHVDVTYEVWRTADGSYRCECPGFAFRKTCRHVKAIATLRALPLNHG